MNNKRLLLCTFSTTKTFRETVENIKKFYDVADNRFFVFSNTLVPEDVFITYNVFGGNDVPKFQNTISVHRKKQSNTLYTLNAMNQIIKDDNGGTFDSKHAVDWSLYSNSLIITGHPSIRIIPIKLIEILS